MRGAGCGGGRAGPSKLPGTLPSCSGCPGTTHQGCCPSAGWRPGDWPTGTAHAQNTQACRRTGHSPASCALHVSPPAPKLDGQQEGKNAPKRIIQWLLGGGGGSLPCWFLSPNHSLKKQLTRSQSGSGAAGCGLGCPVVDGSLSQLATSERGGDRDRRGLDHLSQSRPQPIRAVGSRADHRGCC